MRSEILSDAEKSRFNSLNFFQKFTTKIETLLTITIDTTKHQLVGIYNQRKAHTNHSLATPNTRTRPLRSKRPRQPYQNQL